MITTTISTIVISHILVVLSASLIVFAYFRIKLQIAQAEKDHAQNDSKFWRKHYDDLSQRFKAFTDALKKHDMLPVNTPDLDGF